MKLIAANIRTELLNDSDLVALIGDKVYWELAPESAGSPIVNIAVVEQPGKSKDARKYLGELRIYADTLGAVSDIYEVIHAFLKNKDWPLISGRIQFADDLKEQAYGELIFNYK